jgi:competence/damage-inducible protein CinA-like protein
VTTAEIITIGTELLLGEIQDSNTAFLARQLRTLGIDLYRVTTIGDNPLRIAEALRDSLSRADIVVTTGGLGPTIDDPTRNAVAIALNVEVVFHPELWRKVLARFNQRGITPSENNRKQAYLPETAVAIDNPVGTAPAFYALENNRMIVCLPGVPAEMELIFQESVQALLRNRFTLSEIIKTRVLHTSGIGESIIDEIISDLEALQNPTVGLSAHPASVDIRITAKSSSEVEADRMISLIESEIRMRMPDEIYGADGETLTDVIIKLARQRGITLQIITHGCDISLFPFCDRHNTDLVSCVSNPEPFTLSTFTTDLHEFFFAVNLLPTSIEFYYINGDEHDIKVSIYNGPAEQMNRWLVNTCMDFMWRKLRF